MNNRAPIVAIVGRANVGKSSLFNAIIGRREAITAREAGTTRDKLTAKASWQNHDFWLVDTAGSIKEAADDFELTIQEQIKEAAATADVILLVTEADVPINDEDRRLAKMALKSRRPVLLVVNKLDKNRRADLKDWLKLGIRPVIGISVAQKRGIDSMLDELTGSLPKTKIAEKPERLKLAFLGRPNVGKSSLFNRLAAKEQAVVSSRAGTTRDVNRAFINHGGQELEIMDTAGIRRSGKVERGIEYFSMLRSLAAIEEADVGILLIDATEPGVQLDQKIAGLIKEAGKGLIVAISKSDSIGGEARRVLASQISQNLVFVPWAPLVFTSAISGQNAAKVIELAIDIDQNRRRRLTTAELNSWLRQAVDAHPPAGLKNRLPKLNYMVQEDGIAPPSFKIFGAHTKFLHWSYRRYLEKQFRAVWPFEGVPVKFWFIEKH